MLQILFCPLDPIFAFILNLVMPVMLQRFPNPKLFFFFFRFCLLLHLDELFTMNTYLCRGHTRTHTHTHTSTF